MDKIRIKIRPEITIVPVKPIKKETIENYPIDSEEDEDNDVDIWSGPLAVDPPVLEPLVKIEEPGGAVQGLPDDETLNIRGDQLLQQQWRRKQMHDKQKKIENDHRDIVKKEELVQEADLHDRLEWKALAHGKACTECGREFMAIGCLRQHILTHLAQPVACKATRDMSAKLPTAPTAIAFPKQRPPLPPHVRARRRHSCPTCGKTFIREAHLKRHVLVHTGERPHRCEVCDKCFTASDDLKVHTRVHTGERPHQCTLCAKAFTTAGNLKVHLRVHSGERPYGCAHCGKCFTRAAALKKHQRLHTNAERL